MKKETMQKKWKMVKKILRDLAEVGSAILIVWEIINQVLELMSIS